MLTPADRRMIEILARITYRRLRELRAAPKKQEQKLPPPRPAA